MKQILFSLTLFIALSASSQITYVDTDWIIDQTQIMIDGEVDTLELDFDQDGSKDMRISSWSNHQSGIETVVEVLMLDAVEFGGLENTTCGYISDCPSTGFNYNNITGYIYTSNCASNPYSNQYVKMPFRFEGPAGIHHGLLYVRYVGTTITIEGYAWNQTPNGPCDCSSTGWLSLSKLHMDEMKGNFQYYNLMGQRIEHPSGLTLKVYESGATEKIYIE